MKRVQFWLVENVQISIDANRPSQIWSRGSWPNADCLVRVSGLRTAWGGLARAESDLARRAVPVRSMHAATLLVAKTVPTGGCPPTPVDALRVSAHARIRRYALLRRATRTTSTTRTSSCTSYSTRKSPTRRRRNPCNPPFKEFPSMGLSASRSIAAAIRARSGLLIRCSSLTAFPLIRIE